MIATQRSQIQLTVYASHTWWMWPNAQFQPCLRNMTWDLDRGSREMDSPFGQMDLPSSSIIVGWEDCHGLPSAFPFPSLYKLCSDMLHQVVPSSSCGWGTLSFHALGGLGGRRNPRDSRHAYSFTHSCIDRAHLWIHSPCKHMLLVCSFLVMFNPLVRYYVPIFPHHKVLIFLYAADKNLDQRLKYKTPKL